MIDARSVESRQDKIRTGGGDDADERACAAGVFPRELSTRDFSRLCLDRAPSVAATTGVDDGNDTPRWAAGWAAALHGTGISHLRPPLSLHRRFRSDSPGRVLRLSPLGPGHARGRAGALSEWRAYRT